MAKKRSNSKIVHFKVHTPNLLKEIVDNSMYRNSGVLFIPLNTFRGLLVKVADRAKELNDLELNQLMIDLTLYEEADPEAKGYNPVMCALNKELLEKSQQKAA